MQNIIELKLRAIINRAAGAPRRANWRLAGLLAGGCLGLTIAWGQPVYPPTYAFTTIAGTFGNDGNVDGTNGMAQFNWPQGVAVATNGVLYVVDYLEDTVREVAPIGTNWVVTTIAGSAGIAGSADGTNQNVQFNEPTDIAMDGAGNLYVTDSGNNTLRMLTPVGTNWVSSTIAGTASPNGSSQDGSNGFAQFNYPYGITVDAVGNLYVADTYNDTIRRVVHTGTNWVVTTIAGQAGSNGSSNGTNLAAQFYEPGGIVVDRSGNLYVGDTGNYTIRKITPVGTNWVVTTVAGNAGNAGYSDGTNGAASFFSPIYIGPMGIAVDALTNLYVADSGNGLIRKVSLAGTNWVTTTLAGLASAPPDSTDGIGTNALFSTPAGIAVDGTGRLFVGDIGANDLREGTVAAVPNLAIGPVVANSVVLSWVGYSGFAIQTNGDLTTPNWGNYGGAVSSNNGTNSVTLAPPVGTLFFRLAN